MQLLCQEEWQIVARQNDTFSDASNAPKLSPTLNAFPFQEIKATSFLYMRLLAAFFLGHCYATYLLLSQRPRYFC